MTTGGLLSALAAWWRGGDLLMPAILGTGLVLYACLGAVSWGLWRGTAGLDGARKSAVLRELTLARVVAAVLPLLGLLGTVAGMVQTFADLARTGGSGASAAAGIGLALTATQYGIALAIPALVAEALLRRRVQVLAAALDASAGSGRPC